MDRRELLTLAAGLAATPALVDAQPRGDPGVPGWPPHDSFGLWPGIPPGAPSPLPRPAMTITGPASGYRNMLLRGIAHPTVGVFRAARPDGRAVLIVPGGGYAYVSLRSEGIDVAHAFTRRGITCFVLGYRLPGEGWLDRADTPLADAQRAMRLIRYRAASYRVDPAKLGVLGFSAGGHLAGSLATLQGLRAYRAIDVADRLSARPAFAGLIYAVSNMDIGRSHGGSRGNLLGRDPDPATERRYAVDRHIGRDTPPLFILHAQDDATVPVQNGLDLFAAARREAVPAEAYFPEHGGHGFGVRLPQAGPASLWPDLFDRWSAQAVAAIR